MKTNIIKSVVISEKAYKNMDLGVYTFLVDRAASKGDVATAVKKYFSVDAVKVNITHVFSKKKRVNKTRKFTQVGGGKKATVWLKKGQSISSLSTKTQRVKADKKTPKEKKDKK